MLGGNPSFTFSLFFIFLSHEVVASVATSLYLFLFGFSCQVYPLMHWKCEVLCCCPKRDSARLFHKNPKITRILYFYHNFWQQAWCFYLSFVSFEFLIWAAEVPQKIRSLQTVQILTDSTFILHLFLTIVICDTLGVECHIEA